MNYVDDDDKIVDAADVTPEDLGVVEGLECLRCDPPVRVEPGGLRAHMFSLHRQTGPVLPLKPWEHYTIADGLLRQAGQLIGDVVDSHSLLQVERARTLTMLAQAHAAQASAGALLMQHYSARFSELWAPGNVASTSKEERDRELEAWPGSAKRPAQ